MSIELRQISKSYKSPKGILQVLTKLNFTANSGELVSIQGPSGCGKSTLLLILGAMLEPDAGEIFIHGANPYTMNPNERTAFRGKNIGFVFQQFHLIPYLNVLQNILAPSLVQTVSGTYDRAMELIAEINLTSRMSHLPSQLSMGECQRVALARAFMNRPKLILADEPTGNLDDSNARIVISHLRNYASSGNIVVIASHDMRVMDDSDRTLVCKSGTFRQKSALSPV